MCFEYSTHGTARYVSASSFAGNYGRKLAARTSNSYTSYYALTRSSSVLWRSTRSRLRCFCCSSVVVAAMELACANSLRNASDSSRTCCNAALASANPSRRERSRLAASRRCCLSLFCALSVARSASSSLSRHSRCALALLKLGCLKESESKPVKSLLVIVLVPMLVMFFLSEFETEDSILSPSCVLLLSSHFAKVDSISGLRARTKFIASTTDTLSVASLVTSDDSDVGFEPVNIFIYYLMGLFKVQCLELKNITTFYETLQEKILNKTSK